MSYIDQSSRADQQPHEKEETKQIDMSVIDIRIIVEGITESYVALHDWGSLHGWVTELRERRQHYAKSAYPPYLRIRHSE